MDTQPPPSYEYTGESVGLLPDYEPPQRFTIGKNETIGSLVTISQIRGHLALLGAFARLRDEIQNISSAALEGIPGVPDTVEKRWSWFVALAVERFDLWCHSLQDSDLDMPWTVLPPLDVLMVWHSYLLNPRWFAEDAMRLPEVVRLKAFGHVLSELLENPQVGELLRAPPSEERQSTWEERTLTPFSYLLSLKALRKRILNCPRCLNIVETSLMNAHGTGYLQKYFGVKCSKCDIGVIGRKHLCCRKIAETISSSGSSPRTRFAGSVFSLDRTQTILENGDKIKKEILSVSERRLKRDQHIYPPDEPTSFDYKVDEKLCQAVMKELQNKEELNRWGKAYLIRRIVSAYSVDRIYSIDLHGAVLRQANFLTKMNDLGWTHPERFMEDASLLANGVSRYHAFLHMLATHPKHLMVPTLDIDLIWHTHQLSSETYKSDCFRYLDRFIDHDDKIEGTKLSTAFEDSCRMWKEEFNIDYTSCGCPPPPPKTTGKLFSVFSRPSPSTKQPEPTSISLSPPLTAGEKAPTHPSDHNAVHFWDPRNTSTLFIAGEEYKVMRKGFQKRSEKMRAQEAKAPASKVKGEQAAVPHPPPFLVSLPEKVGYPASCLSGNAQLVDSAGACASGNGLCGGGCVPGDPGSGVGNHESGVACAGGGGCMTVAA